MAGTVIRALVLDIRSNWSGGFGSTGTGYQTSQVGLRKIELFFQSALLGSQWGDDYQIYSTAGDAFTPPSVGKVPWRDNPKIDTSGNKNWLSLSGMSSGVTDEYPQRFMIVYAAPYIADKLVLNNYHFAGEYTARGVKQLRLTSTDQALDPSEADNINGDVPGGIVLFDAQLPQHTYVDYDPPLGNVADDYEIDISQPDTVEGEFAFGLGFVASADTDINSAAMTCGIGLGSKIETTEPALCDLKCGLALGVEITGGAESQPCELLAAIGIGAEIEATMNKSAAISAGLCIACLIRAESVPGSIIEAAISLGCKVEAQSNTHADLKGGFGLGFRAEVDNGTRLCELPEFSDTEWF